jgi:hypothetical protein
VSDVAYEKLNYKCQELVKTSTKIRFLDNGEGKMDVYGQFFQGYIDVEETKFHQSRWCTLPLEYTYTFDELKNEVIDYVSWFDQSKKILQIQWIDTQLSVSFNMEESFKLIGELVELVNKLKEMVKEEEVTSEETVQETEPLQPFELEEEENKGEVVTV